MIRIICFVFIALLFPLDALAHSGGTNAEGCHHNRKTGEYHCHNKKLKRPPIAKTDTSSEITNGGIPSSEKPSGPQNKTRIYKWVDEKGEVHYSNNLDDLPVKAHESMNSK